MALEAKSLVQVFSLVLQLMLLLRKLNGWLQPVLTATANLEPPDTHPST